MRKIIAILSVSFFLVACSSEPGKAVKNFTENLSQGKVEEAKKYATEGTGKIIDLATGFGGFPVEPNYKFEMIKDSIVDNKAWVTFTNQDGEEETIEVVKIDGKWLVHMEPQK